MATTGGGVVHFLPQEGVDDALLAGCALYLHPPFPAALGTLWGTFSFEKRTSPTPPKRNPGRSNLAPGPPNGQKGGAAAPPFWIPHPEGRGSGSGKRSWSSPIFARFCNSDSRGRKLMRVLHPARDLACSSSSAWQLSQNRIPKLARRGKFGIKRLFFWRGAPVFFSARRKENGGCK